MMAKCVICLLCLLFSVSAYGGNLPAFDSVQFCRLMAEAVEVMKGDPDSFFKNCMKEEIEARTRLEKRGVSKDELEECGEWLEDVGKSWQTLEECLNSQN